MHGQVRFLILGPVNNIWNEVTRRHPSFWHHTKWGQNTVPLLAHTSCILIKQLEVKVLSDNGKMGSSGGSGMDIIYMSDTQEDFVNRKDDLEMKITTALTSEECRQLGVNNTANLSSPLNVVTDDSLLSLYSYATQESAKPEQHYVNDYWQEWHEPRVVMKQSMDDGEVVSYLSHYRHPAMGKVFHVVGIDRNLTEGTARMTMKELF